MIITILYKNLKKEHLDDFVRLGKVIIRSLEYYRSIEDIHKKDDLEGMTGSRFDLKETIVDTPDNFYFPENIIVRSAKPNISTYIRIGPGAHVNIHEILPNVYVFCVSEKRLENHGNSAYKINDPVRFGHALARALSRKIKTKVMWRLKKVEYGGHKNDITNREEFISSQKRLFEERLMKCTDAYFQKPSRFESEKEWRYVFKPDSDQVADEEVPIEDKALLDYCEF